MLGFIRTCAMCVRGMDEAAGLGLNIDANR